MATGHVGLRDCQWKQQTACEPLWRRHAKRRHFLFLTHVRLRRWPALLASQNSSLSFPPQSLRLLCVFDPSRRHSPFQSISESSFPPLLSSLELLAVSVLLRPGISSLKLTPTALAGSHSGFFSMGCSLLLSPSTSLRIPDPRSFPRSSEDRGSTQLALQFFPLTFHRRTLSKNARVSPPETRALPSNILSSGACNEEASSDSHTKELTSESSPICITSPVTSAVDVEAEKRKLEKNLRRQSERATYLFAAVASTAGIVFLAAGAVYYRFAWQTQGAEVPFSEMFGTFALAVGAAVGMEFWARWAHDALWHDSLWSMHESHHLPRDGPFEKNDIFAIINAVPAIALMAYGLFHKGLIPGLCFGAGLGITIFGIAYMFVHDGLVHRRFPVGPIANVPYFQKVAAAHQLHHADKFKGVPFGLFLGPQELESQTGGMEELEKVFQTRKKLQSLKS